MALTERDRTDITDLINRHGHLVDAGRLDELGEILTEDITYETSGHDTSRGLDALREAALALGAANPVGHHVTNIVITEIDDHSARVASKGIGIMADGRAGSAVYDDVVVRRPAGWRISRRTVSIRRAALGGDGPRAVLERCRQAAVDRSVEDMRRVYATDAVHEFPFTYTGGPTRLEGRDEIVDWIAAGWAENQLTYERYRTLAIHDTADPNTIVVEQEAVGTSPATGEFALPNIIVLTVRDGQIAHLRDYVNVLAAMTALGQRPQF